MAIAVDGYGNITQSNAKEIYTAWKRGEVDLDKTQQKKCESFLSPEEIDEVQYDEKVGEKRGKDSINTEDAKDNGNGTEAGATVASAVGSIGTIILSIQAASKTAGTNGIVALIVSAAAIVGSAAALAMSFAFDNQLDERKARSGETDANNQAMDTYSDGLTNSMDMMNEDVQTYQEQQDALTTAVNTQTSDMAALQMEYDNAVAMGDTNGAKAAKEQMKTLEEQDNSQLEEDLAETGGAIEEYRAMNVEALGCAESGQTVSDFLKAGKAKGTLAMINGALCAVGALAAGLAAAFVAIPKLWTPFGPIDAPASIVGTVIWSSVAAMMGYASGKYFQKGSQENECGSNGESMQEHVNNLNDMVGQQEEYTTETEGAFAESDEAAAESQADASEKAGEAVSKNGEKNANTKDTADDEKTTAGSGSGGGANA